MTPKEKAKQLVQVFHLGIFVIEFKWQAKDCALIAVDEIWNALESARVFEEYDYWQEVKKEIEKL
jgi:hypothetical protein